MPNYRAPQRNRPYVAEMYVFFPWLAEMKSFGRLLSVSGSLRNNLCESRNRAQLRRGWSLRSDLVMLFSTPTPSNTFLHLPEHDDLTSWPLFQSQSDITWDRWKIAAIARRSGKSTIFTSGSLVELPWGFYGIFGISSISSDSEVSEDVRNIYFFQIKIFFIWSCQILENTRFSLIFVAILNQNPRESAVLRHMGI